MLNNKISYILVSFDKDFPFKIHLLQFVLLYFRQDLGSFLTSQNYSV